MHFFPLKLILKDQDACKFCNKVFAENSTYFNEHLTHCKTYIEKTIMSTIQSNNSFNTAVIAKTSQRNQTTINFTRLTPAHKISSGFLRSEERRVGKECRSQWVKYE